PLLDGSKIDSPQTREEWRIIPSYPQYMASNKGNIKGRMRVIYNRGKRQVKQVRRIKQGEAGGYLFVILSKGGETTKKYVHVLVCEAFIGQNPDPNVYTVDHKDRNPKNNCLYNLRYATMEEQMANTERSIKKRQREKREKKE